MCVLWLSVWCVFILLELSVNLLELIVNLFAVV